MWVIISRLISEIKDCARSLCLLCDLGTTPLALEFLPVLGVRTPQGVAYGRHPRVVAPEGGTAVVKLVETRRASQGHEVVPSEPREIIA